MGGKINVEQKKHRKTEERAVLDNYQRITYALFISNKLAVSIDRVRALLTSFN